MKKTLFWIVSIILFNLSSCSNQKPEVDEEIARLMKEMTLEEKVGQMAQITLDAIGNGESVYSSSVPFAINPERIDNALLKYHVGSILNTTNNYALKPEKWNEIISAIQAKSKEDKLKIPVLYGIDAIHGVTYADGSVLFPHQIALAATFNTDLAYNMAKISAYETKACGIPWNFSPVLDLGADPRFSRQYEGFGEDPYLISEMGVQVVKGYEENGVASCLKHYLGYSVPFSGKDRTPAYIPDHILREYHLEPFRRAVESGASSLMVNSAIINGESVHASHKIITDILKGELGFEGVVVSDWMDIINLYQRDHIAANHKEAIKLAVNAGIDMSMIPYNYEEFCTSLVELVKSGEVSKERIDDAVYRILRLKKKAGLFETPVTFAKDYPEFGSKAHEQAAYNTACESITLLKNKDNTLPLDKNLKIFVTGPNANTMRAMNGGWSYSWQGEKVEQFAGKYNTFLEAISMKTQHIQYIPGISYVENGKYWEEKADQWNEAVAQAKKSDLILLFLGENSYCEKPGDLNDLRLSSIQIEYAKALAKTGKKIVLVLNEGRPRVISEIEPYLQSIVQTYLPGNYGGDALASILFGELNPSGKLPYTYPAYPNSTANYYHKPSESQVGQAGAYLYESDYNPQWEFGHGLSYTTFEYKNLKTDKEKYTMTDSISLSIEVTNTGKRIGKESILVYSSDLIASLTPDVKRLRKFKKVELKAGESQVVHFVLHTKDLAFVNLENKWITEPGEFKFQIGGLNKTITIE